MDTYEKKYKEALERARVIHYNEEEKRSDMEWLFPELKESEGEKIRKELIELVKNHSEFCGGEWYVGDFTENELIAWLEKQAEQKPTYTVKPKFKVGDYIKHNKANIIRKVISVNSGSYYVENIETGGRIELFNAEQNFHLWSIEDAKDGDAIAEDPIEGHPSSFVAIYKKQNEEDFDNFDSYCFVGFDGKFYEGEYGHSSEDIHPATEEQRDLLFQKMKEAGYEWDAENKAMTKIEQKPTNSYCQENCKGYQETGKCFADGMCKARREAEQKQEWSEEDEIGLADALWAIKQARTIAKDENDMGNLWYAENWLKFIKSRVSLKQKWSEEEIEKAAQEWDSKANFNPFYMTMEGGKPTGVKQSITTHEESFKAGVNWILKFLKERTQKGE